MLYPVVVFRGSSLEQFLQLLAVAARFAELSNQLHNTEIKAIAKKLKVTNHSLAIERYERKKLNMSAMNKIVG